MSIIFTNIKKKERVTRNEYNGKRIIKKTRK